jgi:MFS family permease
MSESFGRKTCFLSSFGLYTLSALACALAPNWPILLFFRLLNGIGVLAPQYILGGVYADLYPNLAYRGRAVMI